MHRARAGYAQGNSRVVAGKQEIGMERPPRIVAAAYDLLIPVYDQGDGRCAMSWVKSLARGERLASTA